MTRNRPDLITPPPESPLTIGQVVVLTGVVMTGCAGRAFRSFAVIYGAAALVVTAMDVGAAAILDQPHLFPVGDIVLFALFAVIAAQSVLRVAGLPQGAYVSHILALRRRVPALAFGMTLLALGLFVLRAAAVSLMDVDATPMPDALHLATRALLYLTLAYAVLSQATRPDRAMARVTVAMRQRASAAASRASAVIPAQSPLTIFPFGATQLPPTQSVFGSDR